LLAGVRYSYVTDLARRLQLYRPEHVLSAGYLHDELDVPTFAAYMSYLTPENMVIFLTAKENEGKANKTVGLYGSS
jgi:secreted Zn-dependent insulinase-like peptidase